MKKLLALSLLLMGCGEFGLDTDVLSSDGNRVSYCGANYWIKCVAETCPNGYTILRPNSAAAIALIKCKPER